VNKYGISAKWVVCGLLIAIVTCALFIAVRPLRELPVEIRGEYTTSNPRYSGRYLMLQKGRIYIGPDMFEAAAYKIRKVSHKAVGDGVLYQVECFRGDDDEFTFSFFYKPENNGTIRLKNQKDARWIKKKPAEDEGNHS